MVTVLTACGEDSPPAPTQPTAAAPVTQRRTEPLRDTLQDGSPGPAMVVVPAGKFQMGSPPEEPERRKNETWHPATLAKPFAVGQYEVTFAEYARFVIATGRKPPPDQGWGEGNYPVVGVNWYDALAYAAWLSQQTGQAYRLLTEAEWEYMARAGSRTAYWWGDAIRADHAVCKDCSAQENTPKSKPQPVGSTPANGFGIYDVHGNAAEWTCSRYAEEYNGLELACASSNNEELIAIRSGSYRNPAQWVRAAVRDNFAPADSNEFVGFRIARQVTAR